MIMAGLIFLIRLAIYKNTIVNSPATIAGAKHFNKYSPIIPCPVPVIGAVKV